MRTAELGLSAATDEEVLAEAEKLDRLFVTRDRDFGALVFLRSLGAGVIYLRLLPSNQVDVHSELARVLRSYSEAELRAAFVVVQASAHRFRKLPPVAAEDI